MDEQAEIRNKLVLIPPPKSEEACFNARACLIGLGSAYRARTSKALKDIKEELQASRVSCLEYGILERLQADWKSVGKELSREIEAALSPLSEELLEPLLPRLEINFAMALVINVLTKDQMSEKTAIRCLSRPDFSLELLSNYLRAFWIHSDSSAVMMQQVKVARLFLNFPQVRTLRLEPAFLPSLEHCALAMDAVVETWAEGVAPIWALVRDHRRKTRAESSEVLLKNPSDYAQCREIFESLDYYANRIPAQAPLALTHDRLLRMMEGFLHFCGAMVIDGLAPEEEKNKKLQSLKCSRDNNQLSHLKQPLVVLFPEICIIVRPKTYFIQGEKVSGQSLHAEVCQIGLTRMPSLDLNRYFTVVFDRLVALPSADPAEIGWWFLYAAFMMLQDHNGPRLEFLPRPDSINALQYFFGDFAKKPAVSEAAFFKSPKTSPRASLEKNEEEVSGGSPMGRCHLGRSSL